MREHKKCDFSKLEGVGGGRRLLQWTIVSQVRMGGIQNGMALLSLTAHVFLSLSHSFSYSFTHTHTLIYYTPRKEVKKCMITVKRGCGGAQAVQSELNVSCSPLWDIIEQFDLYGWWQTRFSSIRSISVEKIIFPRFWKKYKRKNTQQYEVFGRACMSNVTKMLRNIMTK